MEGAVQMLGNNLNETKFHSGRNKEQIEVKEMFAIIRCRIFCRI